ncbi:MAG: response regulator [Aliishimia sp.]
MNGKVLVVDDDAEARIIVSDLLARLEVNHTLVSSAGECISRLVADPREFDMVLMDIHMPNLSGADACVWIKDSEVDPPKGIPIIAMTGDATFFDETALTLFGMQGVLQKPISLENLHNTLIKHNRSLRLN